MSDGPKHPGANRSQPLVTVGIPVYNGAQRVAGALESVLNQDYSNLEVVVCDNASEDATEAICLRFAERDSRVRYFRNATNIGLLPNFRRVRDEADGKYFSWLGHDEKFQTCPTSAKSSSFLELNTEVACSHTSISFLNDEVDAPPAIIEFAELSPHRPWADARRELFRWPHEWLEMASFGVFRAGRTHENPYERANPDGTSSNLLLGD